MFLAWRGVEVTLVERHPGSSPHPRAVGYTARTMELLRAVGLGDKVPQTPADFRLRRVRVESLARTWFDESAWTDEETAVMESPCVGAAIAQDRLEPVSAIERASSERTSECRRSCCDSRKLRVVSPRSCATRTVRSSCGRRTCQDYKAEAGRHGGGAIYPDAALELGQLYRSNAVIGVGPELPPARKPEEWCGQPGTRAPHVWLAPQFSTLDLLQRGWVVVSDDDRWGPQTLRIDGAALATFGLSPGGAALIRPDGYIAWRSIRDDRRAWCGERARDHDL
jgi:hypothetical protein